ncbi:hypothetical protein SAMN02745671_01150 [Anaerovibrio lipolyticus DSM 3074]|uniref:Uncharacterized protein n=1 Tax=Anaerovibrio lipolyticus DSM 3074 TaxID=1120997 RepID=A0A1M6CK12_9FIRM|nr:hypothetical protein [Anaerovibrio lipolyticus]SHI61360.1 hypothetical protein SAMN02745671_01150 [Anaerovibrio lipolyticus DSM 3074]
MAGFPGNFGGYQGAGQQVNQSSMVVFINDDNIAVNYPVAPGMTVALINPYDPDNGKMYIKSTAVNGMPNPTRVFELREVLQQKQVNDSVSRQEFEAFSQSLGQQIQGLQKALAGLQVQPVQQVTSTPHMGKGGKNK